VLKCLKYQFMDSFPIVQPDPEHGVEIMMKPFYMTSLGSRINTMMQIYSFLWLIRKI
jgi:hypothetical protein